MLDLHLNRRPLTRRAVVLAAIAIALVTAGAATFRAQQTTPLPLTGSVFDPSGAVIPEVALTLRDAQDITWKTTTDGSGRFQFEPVRAGHYTLEAELPGFKRLHLELDLKAASDWDRAITLPLGEVQESISVQVQRRPKSATPAAPASPARVRVGGNIRPPMKLKDVRPVYPPSMQEAGREGVVSLEAVIGRDGMVTSTRVVSAGVHPDFAQAAIDAVRQWRFAPTLLNGSPVEVVMNVSIEFDLAD